MDTHELVKQRDHLIHILVGMARQDEYSKTNVEAAKVIMNKIKALEKQLKSKGYKGPYMTVKARKRSCARRRSKSRSKRKRRQSGGGAKRKRSPKPKSSSIQSLLFKKEEWTVPKAVQWLDKHGYGYSKVDVTDNYYRFRQFPPRGRMRTITFSEEDGIKAVVSFPKSRSN